jgi:hypothetical protein
MDLQLCALLAPDEQMHELECHAKLGMWHLTKRSEGFPAPTTKSRAVTYC